MIVVVLLLLIAVPALAAPGWRRPDGAAPGVVWAASAAGALALSGLAALAAIGVLTAPAGQVVVGGLAVLAAVVGGGPATEVVLRSAERGDRRDGPPPPPAGVGLPPPVLLRGGAWIGALERAGTTVALLLGSAEAVAIVLAVKGLGRYPELRHPMAAERFIVGTFTSVLWAAACAGVAALLIA
jgi:hypothetical protein